MAELSENELLLLSQLGYSLYKEGQYQKAINIFEGLSELRPRSSEMHAVLAVLYHLTNSPQDALREAVEALKGKQNDVALLMTLGEVYLTLKQKDNARDILTRAYEQARRTNHPAQNRIYILLQSNP
jgi:Flp pilus assembly protein TadD